MQESGRSPLPLLATSLLAIVAIGAAAWLYVETQDSQQKSAAEIAQLKLSLELYGRQYMTTATSMTEVNATLKGLETRLVGLEEKLAKDLADLSATPERTVDALEQRLSRLEEYQLNGLVGPAVVVAPEPEPAPAPAPQPTTSKTPDNCVSQNSPFLVAAGDIFPVCGTSSWVAVTEVGQQKISFANGDSAYVGRSVNLDGTNCTLTVRSANAAWLAGYGEVQISC